MEGAKTLKLGYNSEKRQIVLFLLFTCIILVSAAVVLYLIPYIGFTKIHPKLPLIMAVVIGTIVLYLVGGALTLVFTIIVGNAESKIWWHFPGSITSALLLSLEELSLGE